MTTQDGTAGMQPPNAATALEHARAGDALADQGRLDEALASYRRALQIQPDLAAVHCNLGSLLLALGRPGEAEACYRQALRIQPDLAEALSNLGSVLDTLERLDEAEACCRRALQLQPALVEAHCNLGNILRKRARLDEAETCYRRALALAPDLAEAHGNLAMLLLARGNVPAALPSALQSLRIRETSEARDTFVDCVRRVHFAQDDPEVRAFLVRALTEPWGRPGDLADACISLLKLAPGISDGVKRADAAWPRRLPAAVLFGTRGLAAIADDALLRALLESAPVCDIAMERFLTNARSCLLEAAARETGGREPSPPVLGLHCAIARQCFINEYVFACAEDEFDRACALRDSLAAALEAGENVPAAWLPSVASYFPLDSLPGASRLCTLPWPGEVGALLTQQVREPEEERQLRATIPQRTRVEAEVSRRVRDQYEENPYPRWVKLAPSGRPKDLVAVLRERFPLAPIGPAGSPDRIDVLVAGCGTGQHPLETARRLRGARILAIDLSSASLAYAMRKTREAGVTGIEYAQADLLELESLGRHFDLIESAGVLHHLADPFAGWRVLLSLLRPGGFMRLGFYSELARRDIVRTRNLIAAMGYGSTADEVRRCRQELVRLGAGHDLGAVFTLPDFFSTSACRDLLFHVQEHRMTLAAIDAFLRDRGLAFLGFDVDPQVLREYARRFPEDRAAIRLDQWQRFEEDNPDTFLGMYQFWIRKPF